MAPYSEQWQTQVCFPPRRLRLQANDTSSIADQIYEDKKTPLIHGLGCAN